MSCVATPAKPNLATHRNGAVAMEFAILAIPFFIMLLGVMEIGYDMFVQEALDNAVETASRSVQVGNTQCSAGVTSAAIVAAVCPALSPILSCNFLTVGVEPIPAGSNYYTGMAGLLDYNDASGKNSGGQTGQVNTGSAGTMMLLGAWYNGPTFLGALVPGFSSSPYGTTGLVHQTYAQSGFVNEYYPGVGPKKGCT